MSAQLRSTIRGLVLLQGPVRRLFQMIHWDESFYQILQYSASDPGSFSSDMGTQLNSDRALHRHLVKICFHINLAMLFLLQWPMKKEKKLRTRGIIPVAKNGAGRI